MSVFYGTQCISIRLQPTGFWCHPTNIGRTWGAQHTLTSRSSRMLLPPLPINEPQLAFGTTSLKITCEGAAPFTPTPCMSCNIRTTTEKYTKEYGRPNTTYDQGSHTFSLKIFRELFPCPRWRATVHHFLLLLVLTSIKNINFRQLHAIGYIQFTTLH